MNKTLSGLSVQNLACERGYRELFTELDFLLEPGQVLRVEGENGSGKTSLLRILAGLAQPADGRVLWNNQLISHSDTDYFRNMLYLGHKPGIKFELTPVENLHMSKALFGFRQDTVSDALQQLGLYGFEDIPCACLSAGQKRRVALAQLLLTNAKLWILDEPYTSLDKAAIVLLEDLFKKHVQNDGLLVITSHQSVSLAGGDTQRLILPSTRLEAA